MKNVPLKLLLFQYVVEFPRRLITGAGQCIGRACAVIFASKGTDLVLLDKNPETLSKVDHEVGEMGRKVTSDVVDPTNLERLRKVAGKARKIGLIDILVNNAGFDRPGTTAKIDKKGFEDALTSTLPSL